MSNSRFSGITKRRMIAAAVAVALPCVAIESRAQDQPTTAPAVTATTAPTTTASTQPNHNGIHGVTIAPGGNLMLNFKDASIEAVLDELSSAAGFIVVKQVPRVD